jgi:YbgC/YbaW family acyl-CoA thioester hydrolase
MGLSEKFSDDKGLYWVIHETEIQFLEPLRFMDEFDLAIWMPKWKRVRGTCAFIVKRKSDQGLVARGFQQIVCMDQETNRPTQMPDDLINRFLSTEPMDTGLSWQRFPKLPPVPETVLSFQQKVAWQDVDMLEMVNNAVFISYAEEALMQMLAANEWSLPKLKAQGLEITIKRVHIQYKKPAVWNDTINMLPFLLELNDTGGSFFVSMTRVSDAETIANCILDWSLMDVNRMKVCSLPDSLKKRLENG